MAGETDEQYSRRIDWEYWIDSLKEGTNIRLKNGGGFKRRPGLARVAALSSTARLVPFVASDGTRRLVILEDEAYRVMKTDETMETTVASGMDWTDAELADLQADAENNDITITHQSFFPQVMTRTLAGSWSVADMDYLDGGDGSISQPYYRFPETKGITLTPSAVTGAGIDLTASASVFVAGHVGTRFRLYDREVEIATVTNGTTATCDVEQTLYPTLDITVASSAGFNVGDQVSTDLDELEGEVVSVPDGTSVFVNMIGTYNSPSTAATNNLVGPTAKSAIASVSTAGSPSGTTQWDEQLISAVRGYPGGNAYHRGRRCLYQFPSAPELFCASAQDVTDDFDLGSALDSDAIQASIGDALGRLIVHAVSTEQLIVLTEVGPYYVGEGPGTPFTPTTIDFLDIGPEPSAMCNPLKTAEGVIYADKDVSRLMILGPTGNVRRSWDTGDLSDLAPHMLGGLARLCFIDGCEWGPERYVAAINSDGELAVMHYRRGEEILGWVNWTTDGTFIDIALFNNKVYCVVLRDGTYYLERFDEDRLLDSSKLKTSITSTFTDSEFTSETLEIVWRKTVSGENRRASLGTFTANGSGVFTGLEAESRDYEVGRSIEVTVEPYPPIDNSKPFQSAIRLARATLDIVASGYFEINGQPVTPYTDLDDQEELPPLRTQVRRKRLNGRKDNPRCIITQPVAAPLEVRALILETS